MRISQRASRIAPFYVMEMAKAASALAQQARGSDKPMVFLNIGEPDFTAPPLVQEAAVRAIHQGRTQYTQALGLDRLREQVRGVVTDEIERFLALAGDDLELGVALDRPVEIFHLAIDLDGQRGLRKAWADRGRDVRAGAPARRRPHRAVGQGDTDFRRGRSRHGTSPLLVKQPKGCEGAADW